MVWDELTPEQRELLVEQYLILLIGVVDTPIPTNLHLHKEFFILRNVAPDLSKIIKFEKHMYGPYSPDLNEALKNPVYYPEAFEFYVEDLPLVKRMITKISLTSEGRAVFRKLTEEYSHEESFKEFLAIAKAIRLMYDSLSVEELLLLIYSTFKDWTKYSSVYTSLMAPSRRKRLAYELYRKGIISKSKYQEILEAKP
ncbi:hypothetical protein OCC_07923 [Thermococcus litoralis DSM 5473]|uniref:DUF4065 domain-containing protein n=1 Tax=Thermococcus litoralis (strain ATCC 51850 / DSM 5473 / JCM 8560 / NS-C) TaxID=523849 RepID=H3ZKX7_THELN|nr:hypothetical protein [Thermococcus litoralis]EHR79378.1 hypothetical protein OCC_07923 [Thermococcus litoralis DSM 5473]